MAEHLQDAVKVSQTWSEAIDKLVQNKISVDHVLEIVADIASHLVEELGLYLTQCFGCGPATFGENWVGVFPLTQLN